MTFTIPFAESSQRRASEFDRGHAEETGGIVTVEQSGWRPGDRRRGDGADETDLTGGIIKAGPTRMYVGKSRRGRGSAAAVAIAAASVLIGTTSSFAPTPRRGVCPQHATFCEQAGRLPTATELNLKLFEKTAEEKTNGLTTKVKANGASRASATALVEEEESASWLQEVSSGIDDEKKFELIALGIWGVSISAFILINNFYGPWPTFMKAVPGQFDRSLRSSFRLFLQLEGQFLLTPCIILSERAFFLGHMIGGMMFGGGIIMTTLIERAVAKSNDASVLQFWFDKVPILDSLVVVPALTVSMISGSGLAITRYGGLNVAPPHVDAIFWTLIAFMTWWASTDLTTQGTALRAVEDMYERYENGERDLETPKVVSDRHLSNVVSCFFILLLYSM